MLADELVKGSSCDHPLAGWSFLPRASCGETSEKGFGSIFASWWLKLSAIHSRLVTFMSSHSNRSGIPFSSQFHNHRRHGTNNTSSILSLFHLLSGITGSSSLVQRGKALPNHSVIPETPAPPWSW